LQCKLRQLREVSSRSNFIRLIAAGFCLFKFKAIFFVKANLLFSHAELVSASVSILKDAETSSA